MAPTISLPATPQDFPIVGIGASAGGLDAFKRFIKAIPENSGFAYVIVQHLDPSHESILPDILSRSASIKVNEITDDIHLVPNNIYVIPANKTLTATDGVLKLTSREKLRPHLPIDVFFTSLAEVHQSLAVGVVLSGTASDGTLGLKAIKAYGGITFAQDQESSAYGGMPQNAVNAEVVDFVLPPEQIPIKLLQIVNSYNGIDGAEAVITKEEENISRQIISILSIRSGVDFAYYKQNTIRRRIARRMAISRKDKLSEYLKLVKYDKGEQDLLFQDVLLPVTSFFRDPKIFQTVNEQVFPQLLRNKTEGSPIRIWVAGCSTGEEAYSIAIALREFLGDDFSGQQVQIFASDVSATGIAKARTSIYHSMELKNIPDAILKKYFTKDNGGYQVNRQIRDMCVFAVHNFLKDPPFVKMDLISCRNVLIYFDTFLQKKALTTFHYSLKETGFLVLGKSETTGPASELFLDFAKDEKIYLRKPVPGRFMASTTERREETFTEKDKKASRPQSMQADFRKSAEAVLLAKYTPASVIINDHMDIVHIHGTISPFLEPTQGKPTFNLLKMAREGLSFELRNTLHKAKTTNELALKEGIIMRSHGVFMQVTIEILPLANTAEPHFLVLFHKTILPEKIEKTAGDASSERRINEESIQRIDQLEKELAQTREDMRAITEDQENVNEELQSANEELLSSNEEMQSLNEEMETSKEELQSTNEELIIVNQELTDKQAQINSALLYSEAIIATVREPLVVLDKALCIKSINASFFKQFNVTEQEAVGEFIFEIKEGLLDIPSLRTQLEKVLPKRIELIDFEIIINLPGSGNRNMLLNARSVINEKKNNKDELILVTIEDITERKTEMQKIKTFSESLETTVKERTSSLEQSNQQLEQFAHTASHELQEPLRKIMTFSKILQQSYSNGKTEEVEEYLLKMEDSSTRMSQLVQHLLDFASVSDHKKVYEKTDLNKIFKNILNDFELLIEEKSAQVTIDKLPEIEAVPFQMHQLFYDLFDNALKFSKAGVPSVIEISSHKLTKDQVVLYPDLQQNMHYYDICIKDNGIGFDQKYAQQIFNMFQRLNANTNYSGTGIGLALCKKIVTNYKGEIFAHGKKNEGATFHVILPTQQPEVIENN